MVLLMLLLDGNKAVLLMFASTSEEGVCRPSYASILKVQAKARPRIVIDDYVVVEVELVVEVHYVDLYG